MSSADFLRVAKLKGGGIITVAGRHNLREIQAEQGTSGPIDATRSRLNYTLAGPATAGDVARDAKALKQGMAPLRRDAVMALELVLSLPVNSIIDHRAYFTDCLLWVQAHFGCPVLSAVVHLDEAAPHCHVLLLPLRDGRMVGNKLMGGRAQMRAMKASFHETVASKYGLREAPARLTGTAKATAAGMVLARLKETGDSALSSDLWPALRTAIENAPDRFLEALGLVVEPRPRKTMAQIFTSTGKGPRREKTAPNQTTAKAIAFGNQPEPDNAIAFEPQGTRMQDADPKTIAFAQSTAGKDQKLCSVVFAATQPAFAPRPKTASKDAQHPADADQQDEVTVEREPGEPDNDDARNDGDPFAYIDLGEQPAWQD